MADQKETERKEKEKKIQRTDQADAGKLHLLTGLLAILIVVLAVAMAHEVFFLF